MRGFWRSLTADGQLRWLGPEKGVIQLAAGRCRQRGLGPVGAGAASRCGGCWRISSRRRSSARSTSATSGRAPPGRGGRLLGGLRSGREERLAELEREGYPAYTTSAGWLGYEDEKIGRSPAPRSRTAGPREDEGGRAVDGDVRRAAMIRGVDRAGRLLMMDANQVWDVDEAIAAMAVLGAFDP